MGKTVDCAIIGGGPAGLVGALYLLRFRRSVMIADKGASRAALIPRSHNYPGFPDGVSGKHFLTRLHQQVRQQGAPSWAGAALGVERDGDGWRVILHDGVVLARRVLIATGVVDRWPRMLNAQEAVRHAALRFCPICDGFEARDDRIAIIGNDDHAAREALFLRTYSPSVTLLSDDFGLSPDAQARLATEGVGLVLLRQGSLRYAGGVVCAEDRGGQALEPFAVAYGALGVDPQSQILAGLGAKLDVGCVWVDAQQQTSIPGVYAAGDVVRGLDQISVAVGEAAVAATAIHNSLRGADA